MSENSSNRVTWYQLPADDVDRAWEFYGQVFGWSQEAAYANDPMRGAINGEIAPRDEQLQVPRVVVRVDDIAAALEKIVASGGKVVLGRTEIPEIGMVFATFEDTEGKLLNIVGDL